MAQVRAVGSMPRQPHTNTTISWVAVVLVPFMFGLWFWLAMVLIGDPNEPTAPKGWNGAWRVIVLWAVVEIIPLIGLIFGRRAMNRDESGGRGAFITNSLIFVGLTLLTLVGGLKDALT